MAFEPSFDWVPVQKAIQDYVEKGSGLSDDKVRWGEQDAGRPPGPAITLRITNIAEITDVELNVEENLFPFADKVVTAVVGNTLTIPNHGLETGAGPVLLDSSTDDPPAPLVEGKNVWVIAVDADHVQLADTFEKTGGGDPDNPVTPIALSDAGSGTLTLKSTAETLHAMGALGVARSLLNVSVEMRCHANDATGNNMAMAILQRVRTRRKLESQRDILKAANLSLIEIERVRAINGIKDALLFLPKAYMVAHFSLPVSEAEAMQIISSVELTDVARSRTFTVQ